MKSVLAKVSFSEKASRVELLVRIVWAILAGIVLFIFGIISGIAWIVQIVYILVTGRRHKSLQGLIKSVTIQEFRLRSYLMLLTDERPPIVPEMMDA